MREAGDGATRDGYPARTPPTAEAWARLHELLAGIGDRSRGLPEREWRAYLATQAREMCGQRPERLRRGGPFHGLMAHEAYAAEFLGALLVGSEEGGATDRAIEARMRTRFLGWHPQIAELRRTVARYLGVRMPILLIDFSDTYRRRCSDEEEGEEGEEGEQT